MSDQDRNGHVSHYPPRPSRVAEGPGEDVSVAEVLDMTASSNGIAHELLEELTIADLARLGARIRKAPA